jgi:hypothetical protein
MGARAARGNRKILRKPSMKSLSDRRKKFLRRMSAAWKNCLLGVRRHAQLLRPP